MLVLILIDVQYLHVVFSLENDLVKTAPPQVLTAQLKKISPSKIFHLPLLGKTSPTPLLLFAKSCTDPFQTKIPHQGSF